MNNGVQNSRIEILLGVIRNLLDDIATLIESSSALRNVCKKFSPRAEALRDYNYISSRTHSEGVQFLTISLPNLGKWYDGVIAHRNGDLILGFKPYHHFECEFDFTCPLLCRMLAYTVLCEGIPVPDKARVIQAYRSLFYLYYKLEVPMTREQLDTALQNWKDNELELEEFEFPAYYDDDLIQVRDIISVLVHRTDDCFERIDPQHGPGAVAGGEDNEQKWETASYIKTLHSVYPRYDYYFGWRSSGRISTQMCSEIISFVKRSGEAEAVSRLLFVPKDSRGPRTISCEPKELMFLQQGVARNLMRLFCKRSHSRINFVDQDVNGSIALASSESGEYATIDLKDASDRVSTQLVMAVFPEWTHKYLLALRSYSTKLPDGSLFEGHRKYAPMGSALCFPIESACFWALAVLASIKSGLSADEAMASTYVYGDDIIIRPQAYDHLVRTFEKFALKVNYSKSYVDGPFRESCGVDAWNGIKVTPFKIKKDISRRTLDGNLATAICKYSSTCYSLDYRATGDYLFELANRQYPGILRHCRELGGLSVVDPYSYLDLSKFEHGYDRRLCHIWVKGWMLSTSKKPSHLDGLSRLLKSYYGDWREHDPSEVAVLRSAKIRKRKILVESL